MKKHTPGTLGLFLLLVPFVTSADTSLTIPTDASSSTDVLITTLGAYLGYDLTSSETLAVKHPIESLLDAVGAALSEQLAYITVFGATPVNASSEALSAFTPSGTPYAALNAMSNYTFTTGSGSSGAYNTVSGAASGGVSVNNLIDQATFQNDPTNQAVLNILGTPDYTYCMNNDATAWISDCSYLYNTAVKNNAIGTLPTPASFFTYTYNQAVIPQLNGNTLTAPLLYTTTGTEPTGGSTPAHTTNQGLTASNQLQQAANFIRYATYAVNPLGLPDQESYNSLYNTATSTDPAVSAATISNAQANLLAYLANLRIYAAQMSVPIGTLYGMLAKRMPQQNGSDTSTLTSQALSEFQMATRRFQNPANDKDKQWIDQINTASAATVEKEIAILLAEMNYQLYLNRQQEERQLLTSTMLLLQASRQYAPDFATATDAVKQAAPTS